MVLFAGIGMANVIGEEMNRQLFGIPVVDSGSTMGRDTEQGTNLPLSGQTEIFSGFGMVSSTEKEGLRRLNFLKEIFG